MRTTKAAVKSFFLLGIGGACGHEQGPGSDAGIVELEMDLRIGSIYGAEETQFGDISALAVDDAGSVYVGDRANYEVRKFDRNGAFVMSLGGRGSGPGEFTSVSGVAVLEDGRVAVVDSEERRVSLFDPSTGEYSGQWTIPSQWLTWARHRIVRRSGGGAYLGLAPRMALDGTPVQWPRPVFVAVDTLGSVMDTIWAPERYVDQCGTRSSHAVRSGYREDARAFYAPKVVWAISPFGELLIGCPRELHFDIMSPGGTVVSSESVPVDDVLISADEMAWFLNGIELGREVAERLAEINEVEVNPVNELLRYDYPASKAAYKTITVARDGTVWVRLSQPSREFLAEDGTRYWQNEMGGVFEVFDSSGRHIGRATLPAEVWIDPDLPPAVPAVVTHEHLWAVTLDSLHVEYVARYRIGWPEEER